MTATKTQGYTAFQRQIAAEGLNEHSGCCPPETPCEIAQGLRKILKSTKLAQDIHPDAERRMPRGNGARKPSIAVPQSATDKQLGYIRSLLGQLQDVPQRSQGAQVRDLFQAQLDKHSTEGTELPKHTASRMIEQLKPLADAAHRNRIAYGPAPTRPVVTRTPITEGMYELDGNVYRTKLSGAGRLYAMLLVIVDGVGSFEYAPGIVNTLLPEHRMTLERASQLSVQYHFCVRCTKELTKKSRIAQGMGDWCAGRI